MDYTFWIIIIYFVLQIGGVLLSRLSRRMSEQAKERRAEAVEMRGSSEPKRVQAPARPAPARPAPARRSPDDIAEEIRRIMGLEREESKVEVLEEVYEPPIRSVEPEFDVVVPQHEEEHGGHLQDRMHNAPHGLESRHIGSDIGARSAALGSLSRRYHTKEVVVKRRRDRLRYVDLTSVARAIATMEVLGPPKALRTDDGF